MEQVEREQAVSLYDGLTDRGVDERRRRQRKRAARG